MARRDERGSGPLSAWFGFVVFLGLLLFAVQVLFNLRATSAVTAVAYDAARQALGRYSDRVTFEWAVSDDLVILRVRADNPSFLLPAVAGPVSFGEIDRTIRLRVERFR